MVYAASTLSLALLEIIAMTKGEAIPSDYMYAPVLVPDGIAVDVLDASLLPAKWYAAPAPRRLQQIGDDWIRAGTSVALVVPSAIVRIEENTLLNPLHADFRRLRIGGAERLPLDDRL